MASSLLVVPPFLKSVSGPLLGPAMLAGAAREGGHDVHVLDLNAAWLDQRLDLEAFVPGHFVGDHDRPSEALRAQQSAFVGLIEGALPVTAGDAGEHPALTLPYSHVQVREAADRLADEPALGGWIARRLASYRGAPAVVGLSVLYSGQVLAALATTIIVRRIWPSALVVWGGSHVTALRDAIVDDARFGWAADRFVVGHAERTFVAILDAVERGSELPHAALVAGQKRLVSGDDDAAVVPVFSERSTAWPRLTLPAQTSRGCAYGRCAFCTYPAIEGRLRVVDDRHLTGVLRAATAAGAALSLKDSLVVPGRLDYVARQVDGRLRWSACTKLAPSIDAPFARRLARAGCATIEVGLETLTPDGQLLFDKRQTPELFRRVLGALVGEGISVVVNYMTGLPGVDPTEEAEWLAWVREEVVGVGPLVKVEHNTFQLERLSPMGQDPSRFGLRVTRAWPWASVMAWERPADRAVSPLVRARPRPVPARPLAIR